VNPFAPALDVANAVLYEGYLLYPYTASSGKNRIRWQFGVVVPRAYLAARTGDSASQQCEVLIESGAPPRVDVRLRFLQVESRVIEAVAGDGFERVESLTVGDRTYLTFDEAAEREIDVSLDPAHESARVFGIDLPASLEDEPLRDAAGTLRGRIVRERWALRGSISLSAQPAGDGLTKVRVLVENESEVVPGETRDSVVRTAFVSTHILLHVGDGRFLSVVDPPETAAAATAALESKNAWPILMGERAGDDHGASLVLASPIILYDFAETAKKIDGELFDATEVDELLQLSVLSLSDAERNEARATDPRARAIVERAERFGREQLSDIHGGDLRRLDPVAELELPPMTIPKRNAWNPIQNEDPFASLDVPAIDCVFIDGVKVSKGSSVRLHPKRRADVWDTFLKEKIATVCAIHQDLEDNFYVSVLVDDDPASEMHEWYGRSFFFYPEEVEPLAGAETAP
jgi:hypothetical protein